MSRVESSRSRSLYSNHAVPVTIIIIILLSRCYRQKTRLIFCGGHCVSFFSTFYFRGAVCTPSCLAAVCTPSCLAAVLALMPSSARTIPGKHPHARSRWDPHSTTTTTTTFKRNASETADCGQGPRNQHPCRLSIPERV